MLWTGIRYVIGMAVTGFLAVVMIVLPREYIKARIAVALGDPTPRKVGRVTLNPFVHLDPIGTITFVLWDFGWSRPVPIRPWNIKGGRKVFLLVSLIGPTINILCFFAYGYLAKSVSASDGYVFETLSKAAKYSLTYALFSLFPIPPLDGSRILGALLPKEYTEWYLKYEIYGVLFMLALVALWIMRLVMNPFIQFIEQATMRIIH